MAKSASERIFIKNARLSFPALDEKRPVMKGSETMKYQATFLIDKNDPQVKAIWDAIARVARAEFKDKADMVLRNRDKLAMKDGDARETAGYAGNVYINAKSEYPPELRDANPRICIKDPKVIREKFVAGYRVNAYIDLFAFEFSGMRGVSAGLVSVQFAGYDEAFSGVSLPKAEDYPDCSEQVGDTQAYDTSFNPTEYNENDYPF